MEAQAADYRRQDRPRHPHLVDGETAGAFLGDHHPDHPAAAAVGSAAAVWAVAGENQDAGPDRARLRVGVDAVRAVGNPVAAVAAVLFGDWHRSVASEAEGDDPDAAAVAVVPHRASGAARGRDGGLLCAPGVCAARTPGFFSA